MHFSIDSEHFDFSTVEKLFHLGYLLLLDALDKIYEDGTSGASRVLKKACQSGLKTSVDLVSEDSDCFEKLSFQLFLISIWYTSDQ